MKIKPDDTIDHFKSCSVANGYTQFFCQDYGNTFLAVAKITIVCPFFFSWLSSVSSELNIKRAFLHGEL